MKRITAIVTAAAASGTLAAAAVSAGMLPASASTTAHPAVQAHHALREHRAVPEHRAAQAKAHQVQRQIARKAKTDNPVQILSQYGNGQYVSVVSCQGRQVPPPLHVGSPGMPLHLSGQQPSPSVMNSLRQYKPVYRCTLVIKKRPALVGKGGGIKPCEHAKPSMHGKCNVILNTGFGGAAASVKGHRPRH